MPHFNHHKLKAWLVAASAFGLWAISIDYVWTRFIINGTEMSDAARLSHLIRERGSEIPIIGNSSAHDDFIPEYLGDDFFNYGMDGISLDVVDALLQIECKKNKRTPILLVVNHFSFRSIGAPGKFPLFVRQPEIRQMLERLGLMEWRYWVPGLRYFGYYDWHLKDYLAEHLFQVKKTVRGHTVGFDQPFDQQALDEKIRVRLESGYGFVSFPDQDQLLYETISNAPQRTFIIVVPPVHSSCFANFRNAEGFARYLDALRRHTNVVVMDWGRMALADDCFKDTQHLNEKGAREFSRKLAQKLTPIAAASMSEHSNHSGPQE